MNLNALEYVLSSILRERIREIKSSVYSINVKVRFQDCAINIPLKCPLPVIPTGLKN
jgi:hypothetical protein